MNVSNCQPPGFFFLAWLCIEAIQPTTASNLKASVNTRYFVRIIQHSPL